MKKILLTIFILTYSFLVHFLENPLPETKFSSLVAIANIILLVIATFLTYKVLKFFIEIVENNISKNIANDVSKQFHSIFIYVFSIRLLLLFLNLKLSLLDSYWIFALTYFIVVITILFVILNKNNINNFKIQKIYPILPVIIYLVLDVYTLKGLWG